MGRVIVGRVIVGRVIVGRVIVGRVIVGRVIVRRVIVGRVIVGRVIVGRVIVGRVIVGRVIVGRVNGNLPCVNWLCYYIILVWCVALITTEVWCEGVGRLKLAYVRVISWCSETILWLLQLLSIELIGCNK